MRHPSFGYAPLRTVMLTLATLLTWGCHAEKRAPVSSAAAPELHAAALRGDACAVAASGVTALAVDVPEGVAIELVTSGGKSQVADLRRRVLSMIEQGTFDTMAGQGEGAETASTAQSAEAALAPPEVRLVEDVPNGLRVTMTPDAPEELGLLRARARTHAARMGGDPACAPKH